jgi:hypothetical protein
MQHTMSTMFRQCLHCWQKKFSLPNRRFVGGFLPVVAMGRAREPPHP